MDRGACGRDAHRYIEQVRRAGVPAQALAAVVEGHDTSRVHDEGAPLLELVTLHAGQVVGKSGIRIEAFYSQCWAFARYLWEGENGKYRPALQKLLADAAAGTIYDPTGSLRLAYLGWNPAGVRPMLEHYLGADLPTIEAGYRQFIHKVAYDDVMEQFQMR